MTKISKVYARQIIDSRGNPTIEVEVFLNNNIHAYASSPSGASVGSLEAYELRDKNLSIYRGKSVYNAIKNVNEKINNLLVNCDPCDQSLIDQKMIDLDGTENKSNIGANAILATSIAVARTSSILQNLPLYKYIRKINNNPSDHYKLPIPMMNIINGGVHADNQLDLQEYMIVPCAESFKERLRIGVEIFHHLKDILKSLSYNINVGDEGGFAPNLSSSTSALDNIMEAILKSGHKNTTIAIDAAASEIYENKAYNLKGENKILNNVELVDYYYDLIKKYPISHIEDGMSEEDIEGWKILTRKLNENTSLVSDDLTVTNPKILQKIIDLKIANTILIKPNQIGTITETLKSIDKAHKFNYKTIISHRSGETEDNFISHLAVAMNSTNIKAGSLSRTDRVMKYNELLRIEEDINRLK